MVMHSCMVATNNVCWKTLVWSSCQFAIAISIEDPVGTHLVMTIYHRVGTCRDKSLTMPFMFIADS